MLLKDSFLGLNEGPADARAEIQLIELQVAAARKESVVAFGGDSAPTAARKGMRPPGVELCARIGGPPWRTDL